MTQDSQGAYRVAGRFSLGDAIERRGIGDLYNGLDEQTRAPVQILLVSPHLFPETWMWERSLGELQRIGTAAHQNVVRLISVGSIEDGRLFTASDPPPGPSLAAFVGSAGPLSPDRALPVIEGVVAALEEGRRLGVWHRDLSPSNIFVSPDMRSVKLHYFGLAEPVGGAATGDPWFMAPEQVSGQEPDEQRLVYALGALWYYLACGQPVFLSDDPGQVMQRHLAEPARPPSEKRPDLGIPRALDALLLGALAKSPTQRPAGLAGFLSEARALAAPAPAPAPAHFLASDPSSAATLIAPGGMALNAPAYAAQQAYAAQPAQQGYVAQPAPAPAAAPPQPAPQAHAGQVAQAAPQGYAAQPAPAAAAARSAAPAGPAQEAGPAPGRRKKKKGFRETLWFMKGEAEPDGAAAVDEKELAEVQAGDGSIPDSDQSMDDRYRDNGSITAEDRRKFSIKTGQTGMLPSVQVPEPMDASSMRSLEHRRTVLVWVVIILLVLGGGGAAAAFFLMRPAETFVPPNLALTIAAQVSEYTESKPKKVLMPPLLRELPKGEDKELFAKLKETAAKPETLLPKGAAGAVDYLAALEKRRVTIEKENVGLPVRRQASLWKNIHRRQYRAVEREYGTLKAKIVGAVKDLLAAALKGQKDEALTEAKAACLQLQDSGDLGPDKAAVDASCKALDPYFGLEEDKQPSRPVDERPRPAGASPRPAEDMRPAAGK